MTDPIADMLTRIRNAQAIKRLEVVLPYSKIKHEIAKVLVHEGYLASATASEEEQGVFKTLNIGLKYDESGQPVITHIQRVSKPGLRIYTKLDDVPYVQNGYGVAIVSTSKGILSNEQARRSKVGGEVICEVW